MVNTENTKAEQISNSPITEAMTCVVAELLHTLTAKLTNENGLEVLNRIQNHAPTPNAEKLGEFFAALDKILCSRIVTQFASFGGLNCLYHILTDLEDSFRKLLIQNIYKYLNVITSLPPQSTYCAELLQHLNKNSIFTKENEAASLSSKEWQIAWNEAQKKWEELALHQCNLAMLENFVMKDLSIILSRACVSIVNYFENLLELCKEFVKTIENTDSHSKILHTNSIYAMKHFEEYQSQNSLIKDTIFEMEFYLNFGKMRSAIFQGKTITFLQLAEKSYQALANLLRSLMELETSTSFVENSRSVIIENYLYIQCLTTNLINLDESPREVEKLVTSLYDYASKNNTSCLDLIDEEICNLNACINHESLAKARLAIRLSDIHFPLSVSHKDAILQLTR